MFARMFIGVVTVALALTTSASAQVFDPSKYPDFMGQWKRPPGVANQWDTSKPPRRGQQAPLTPEYQAVLEANLADQALGGQGSDPTSLRRKNPHLWQSALPALWRADHAV